MTLTCPPDISSPSPETSAVLAVQDLAERGGLVYVSDAQPGLTRRRVRSRFQYRQPDGSRLTDPDHVAWIDGLAIPPAWTDVWICVDQDGYLQATGRDDRGRKQYRYHPRWTEIANRTKFGTLLGFARLLPKIRRRVRRDLQGDHLGQDRVVAAVVRLLDRAHIRIGNDDYAKRSGTFGATTLRRRHVQLHDQTVSLQFRGKHGQEQSARLSDRLLTRLIRDLQDLPGQRLFAFVGDDGRCHAVQSETVNAYLRQITGDDVTAKDFRTWHGTRAAFDFLLHCDEQTPARRAVVAAAKAAASDLGNTVAVCRKYYVHPVVCDVVEAGGLDRWRRRRGRKRPELVRTESLLVDLLREAERNLTTRSQTEKPATKRTRDRRKPLLPDDPGTSLQRAIG